MYLKSSLSLTYALITQFHFCSRNLKKWRFTRGEKKCIEKCATRFSCVLITNIKRHKNDHTPVGRSFVADFGKLRNFKNDVIIPHPPPLWI